MGYVIDDMNNYLMHYGTKRHSGRYPWGSGDDPYQHEGIDFYGRIEKLRKSGWEETPENIKNEFGLTVAQYRAQKGLAKSERELLDIQYAKSLQKDGLGATEIANAMSKRLDRKIGESTVRSWLNKDPEVIRRKQVAKNTAEFIKERMKETGIVDVGAGTNIDLNITETQLKQAIALLESEGYTKFTGGIPNVTNPGMQINTTVLMAPGMEKKDFYKFKQGEANITSLKEYITRDGGDTFEKKFHYPESLDSKRMMVRYKEDGGEDYDGIVELRRGVKDLDLGASRYAQVRIMVDGTHYIKGMAVYADDLPPGIDVRFNTNKSNKVPMIGPKDNSVLKPIKNDPDNPFGSLIKDSEQGGQYWYEDPKTGKKKLGLINKRADEGDWDDWSDALPSQFLSKQSTPMAKKQLDLALYDKQSEFKDICAITNPVVKRHLLNKFADECDAAAVELKAAPLPGQKYHVIIPLPKLKDNEIYAPNYENGTQLALIRYPHGGTFEIPVLTVNNKVKEGKKILGSDPIDAVCINKRNAEILSGADYDGDTVMCIPTNNGKIKITSKKPLKDLEGFDNKSYRFDTEPVKGEDGEYHYYRNGKEFRVMNNTQNEMGKITNLINDMTILGAEPGEIARAVKHSMVVIDAEKHKLDYKASEKDNDIDSLKRKYQPSSDPNDPDRYGGASTLISRAKSPANKVVKRQGQPRVNIKGTEDYDPTIPEGALVYKESKRARYTVPKVNKKTGEVTYEERVRYQTGVTKMGEALDARELLSKGEGTRMEQTYASFANSMKDLGRQARIEAYHTEHMKVNKDAKREYREEVASLDRKLTIAESNRPRERQAQVRANAEVQGKLRAAEARLREEYPKKTAKQIATMARKEVNVKKTSQVALDKYRKETETIQRKARNITLTPREYEAINNGAVSENTLNRLLKNADIDELRAEFTPRSARQIPQTKLNKIQTMFNRVDAKGNKVFTLAEIAQACGVSVSTVKANV